MSERAHQRLSLKQIGLWGTCVYLIALIGGVIVAAKLGWITPTPLDLNELGDLLAGAFGPLAIGWVVLGFLQQGEELKESRKALLLQAKELQNAVAQHEAMVRVTEKQLDLDVEVRREQNLLLLSKELPLFQLRAAGYRTNRSTPKVTLYQFMLRNVGQDAHSIALILEGEGATLSPSKFDFTPTRTEVEFDIEASAQAQFDERDRFKLVVVSRNNRDQERSQCFEVGNFQPIELSCTPPRG